MKWVCLHGLGSTKHYFKELQQLLPNEDIEAYDLPGHGEEEALADFTMEELVTWLHHKVTEPVMLVGHSLGAIICLAYAQRFPKNAAHLVLLDGGYLQSADFGVSLEQEIEGARQFIAQMQFPTFEAAIEAEKEEALRWNDVLEEAVFQRFHHTDGHVQLKVSEKTAVAYTKISYQFKLPALMQPITLFIATQPIEAEQVRQKAMQRFMTTLLQTNCIRVDTGHDVLTENPFDIANQLGEYK